MVNQKVHHLMLSEGWGEVLIMKKSDIIRHRLANQQLAFTKFKKPADIVHWLVAMQAQEFAHAKWAIGLRLHQQVKDADVEKAFNDGLILRTHLMRPTWHFVSPQDIRWLLKLTAPRVHAVSAYMYRKLELTPKLLARSADVLAKTLEGGKYLVRTELKRTLQQKKIKAEGLRLGYILMFAELEAIICSGPRQGKQFTYALLDERVTQVKPLSREEALVRFAERYFTSRGPATVYDFANWSGLTMKDAKEGAALLRTRFDSEVYNQATYIFPYGIKSTNTRNLKSTFLMPDYDEYGMSYKDRSVLVTKHATPRFAQANEYSHWLVVNGIIAGTWQHTTKGRNNTVRVTPFIPLKDSERKAVQQAVVIYNLFFQAPTE